MPGWARRATSHKANVSHAWKTSWATSAGWNGASNGNGLRSGSGWLHAGRVPAFFIWRRVSRHSAPVIRARSDSPLRIVSAAVDTRT